MLPTTPDAESGFRTIFEAAGVAICLVDAEGKMVKCNPAMVEMFGYGAEELCQMSFLDITHPDDVAEDWQKFKELIAGRRSTYRTEKRYFKRDGQLIWCVLTVSMVSGGGESAAYVIGIVEDVTERKRAQEALQSTREHLEAGIRASNTGLWDWNLETNAVYYSPEWKSQLGYADHEVSTHLDEWKSRLHPDDLRRALEKVSAFLENPWPNYENELRMRHKDGTYRWILTRASLLRTPDGRPWRMLGAHLDITKLKQAEERLREFEKVVEGLQEMITVVDRDYRYLIANRALLYYREMERDQVVGHSVSEVLGKDAFERVSQPYLDECFAGKAVKYEMSWTYPKLGTRDLLVSYLPIEGSSGIDRVACVLEDITVRKHAERDLREAHQQLTRELQERTRAEQRVRALSERLITAQEEERRHIARELHDDLSQEIAALSILVSTLKRDVPEQNHRMREQIDGIHQRIARLADGIRHLARQLHPAALEYSGIAAALRSYAAEFSAVNGIAVEVEASGVFEDVAAPIGLCLYRVAQEALQNVAKHAQAKAAAVWIERGDGSIRLVIKDSGRGFQYPRAGTDRGLGLVSMSERVRLANGTLNIQSAIGEGTTVMVTVPC